MTGTAAVARGRPAQGLVARPSFCPEATSAPAGPMDRPPAG